MGRKEVGTGSENIEYTLSKQYTSGYCSEPSNCISGMYLPFCTYSHSGDVNCCQINENRRYRERTWDHDSTLNKRKYR